MEKDKVMQNIMALFRPEKKPVPVRLKPEIKKGVAAPKAPDKIPAAKAHTVVDKEILHKSFIRQAVENGAQFTAAQKMDILLNINAKTPIIENTALLGCISRLKGPTGNELNWNEPNVDTWNEANRVLRTKFSKPLSESDQIIYNEIKQTAAEYYYANKSYFDKAGLTLEQGMAKGQPEIFKGSKERMDKDRMAYEEEKKFFDSTAGSDHEEFSKEWVDDLSRIAQDIRFGKHADHIQKTVDIDTVKSEIKRAKDDARFSWMLTGVGDIVNESAAQVIHDVISHPELLDNKDFLLVKGSQLALKENGTGVSGANFQQLDKVRENFKRHVREMHANAPDYKKEHLYLVDDALKTKIATESEGAQHNSLYTPTERIDSIPEATEQDRELKQLLRDMNEQIGSDHKLFGGAQKQEYSYESMGNVMDLFTRFTDGLYSNELMQNHPDLRRQFESLIMHASKVINIETSRGWSDLYMSKIMMKKLLETPELMLIQVNDLERLSQEGTLFDSEVSQALSRSKQQMIQYLANLDYKTHRYDYLKKAENATRIEQLSGVKFDPLRPNDHPWFQEINDPIRNIEFQNRINNIGNDAASLKGIYTGVMIGGGQVFEKIKAAESNLSEAGIWRISNNRGGLNHDVLTLMRDSGYSLKWDPQTGDWRPVAGEAFKDHQKILIEGIWENKELYNDRFKEWAHRDLRKDDVIASVREMEMLRIGIGERAFDVIEGATPVEHRAQKNSLAAFAGQTADSNWTQVADPIRTVWLRWAMDKFGDRPVIRRLGLHEAARHGIDKAVAEQMKNIQAGSTEFNKLAKKYFNILDDPKLSPAEQLAVEQNGLGQLDLIKRGLKGYDASLLPTRLSQLTKEDLQQWITFNEGLKIVSGRISTGYTYKDSGWMNESLLYCFKDNEFIQKFIHDVHDPHDLHGVGLHEQARLSFGNFLNAPDHHSVEDIMHELLHDGEHHDGIVTQLAKYSPHSVLDALHEKRLHAPTEKWLAENAAKFNIFHGKEFYGGGEIPEDSMPITSERFDLLYKRVSHRVQLIENELAKARLGRIDYSKGAEYYMNSTDAHVKEQFKAIQKVCKVTKVDSDKFLNAMKSMSDFTIKGPARTAIATPLYGQYFLRVHSPDARTMWVEHKDLTATKRLSSRVSESNSSGASGIARTVGDSDTVVKALPYLFNALDASDYKTYREMIVRFCEGAKWAGGDDAKKLTYEVMDYAWLNAARRDFGYDMLGVGGDHATVETSEMQRAAGLGRPTMTLNEYDHAVHEGEAKAGVKWHEFSPSIAHATEKEAHLALGSVKWPKFVRENIDKWANDRIDNNPQQAKFYKRVKRFFRGEISIQALWIYRYWSYGLLGAFVFLAGAFDNAKKGTSSGQGGGGGGGGDPHGH